MKYALLTSIVLVALSAALPAAAQTHSVDLIWEADSYTPPFYKGKALYPPQGNVRVVALPHIAGVNPSSLTYTWSEGSTVLGSKSGVGRNILDIEGPLLRKTLLVEVTVSTSDKSIEVFGYTTIPTTDPVVRLYEHDPIQGTLFNRALTNTFILPQEEIRIDAYPFYFSGQSRINHRNEWRINDREVSSTDGPFGLTLRRGEESGSATVSYAVQNMVNILQRASTALRIEF